MTKIDTSCKNCGTCCKKGGPALHVKDDFLFKENILRVEDILTVRIGELVRDDMKNVIVPLPNELIKVAPAFGARPDDWTCRFLTANNHCFLHGRHPAECRALFCKEPESLMQLKNEERLDRKKICEITKSPAWWVELIESHEEQVTYAKLAEWAHHIETEEECKSKFISALEYDRSFRDLVVEKNAAPIEVINFLFGRPLMLTMVMFGLQARQSQGKISIVKIV